MNDQGRRILHWESVKQFRGRGLSFQTTKNVTHGHVLSILFFEHISMCGQLGNPFLYHMMFSKLVTVNTIDKLGMWWFVGIITVVQWAGSESVILGPAQYVGLMVAGTAGELE